MGVISGVRWERWAPASGIVYVLLLVIGFIVSPSDLGDTDEEILAYYADSGNRTGDIVAFFLAMVSILFFLLFVRALRDRLRAVEAEPKGLSALVLGAGVASAALFVAAVSVWTGYSFAVEDSSEFVVDPSLARYVDTVGYLLFTGSVMVTVLLVGATALLAIRTSVLPTWLGWLSLLVAVAVIFAVFFVPLFVFWLWILIICIVMLLRPTADVQPTT